MKTKLTLLRRTIILGLAAWSSLATTQADDTAKAKAQALRLAVDFMPLPASHAIRPHLLAGDVELFASSAAAATQPQPVDLPGLSPTLEPWVTVPSSGPMLADIAGIDPVLVAPVALPRALFTSVLDDLAADASNIAASR